MASGMIFVAARLPGAPAHCLAQKSQNRTQWSPHFMQSHLQSCWVVLYLTTSWLPSPWRLHLASFALFHLSLGLRGWKGRAKPHRPEHGRVLRAYLALLWFAILPQVAHLYPSVRTMGSDEAGPPHSQLPALQGGEVALPGARRGPATATGRAGAARGLVLCSARVGCLGRRKYRELDALDRHQLPGPPVVKLPLAGVGPMRFAWALASLSAWSFPFLSPREMQSDPSFSWDGTQRTCTRRKPSAESASLYLTHRSACLEVGLTDPAPSPDTLRLVHDPFAIRDNPHFLSERRQGHQDGEKLGAVDGLDEPR